jgi:hypothetical protein
MPTYKAYLPAHFLQLTIDHYTSITLLQSIAIVIARKCHFTTNRFYFTIPKYNTELFYHYSPLC